VRNRTVDPAAYEDVLQRVLDRAVDRRSLAHLFIDPPDAGYGRLPGDTRDYAGAVERWLARATARDDLTIMTTSELATWWSARETAVRRMAVSARAGHLSVTIDDPPPGATLALFHPETGWTHERMNAA
jgi:hypothetical protein